MCNCKNSTSRTDEVLLVAALRALESQSRQLWAAWSITGLSTLTALAVAHGKVLELSEFERRIAALEAEK